MTANVPDQITRSTIFPPLPALPAGWRVCWVGNYGWADPPRPEAWAEGGPRGVLLVCVWDAESGRWLGWVKNGPRVA